MSVRRLADEQPESFEFTPENKAWAETEIAKYPAGRQASAVLALLWRAQAQSGYWLLESRRSKRSLAMLDMPKIRVLEVATFYTMFNLAPVGRYLRATLRHDAVHAERRRGHQGGLAQAHRRTGPCDAGRRCSRGTRSSVSAPAATRRWSRSTTTITRI